MYSHINHSRPNLSLRNVAFHGSTTTTSQCYGFLASGPTSEASEQSYDTGPSSCDNTIDIASATSYKQNPNWAAPSAAAFTRSNTGSNSQAGITLSTESYCERGERYLQNEDELCGSDVSDQPAKPRHGGGSPIALERGRRTTLPHKTSFSRLVAEAAQQCMRLRVHPLAPEVRGENRHHSTRSRALSISSTRPGVNAFDHHARASSSEISIPKSDAPLAATKSEDRCNRSDANIMSKALSTYFAARSWIEKTRTASVAWPAECKEKMYSRWAGVTRCTKKPWRRWEDRRTRARWKAYMRTEVKERDDTSTETATRDLHAVLRQMQDSSKQSIVLGGPEVANEAV